MTPRLRTVRLTLRPIAEADFETFNRLQVLDPEVIAYYFAYRATHHGCRAPGAAGFLRVLRGRRVKPCAP